MGQNEADSRKSGEVGRLPIANVHKSLDDEMNELNDEIESAKKLSEADRKAASFTTDEPMNDDSPNPEVVRLLFERGYQVQQNSGPVNDDTLTNYEVQEEDLPAECKWRWERDTPGVEFTNENIMRLLKTECDESDLKDPQDRMALLLQVLKRRSNAQLPPKKRGARTTAKPKRWSVSEVQQHIDLQRKSKDAQIVETYLFMPGVQLAAQIGCGKQTLYKTEFWGKRSELQAEWRQKNGGRRLPRKREF